MRSRDPFTTDPKNEEAPILQVIDFLQSRQDTRNRSVFAATDRLREIAQHEAGPLNQITGGMK